MELVNFKLIMTVYVIYIVGVIGDEVTNEQQLAGSKVNIEQPHVEIISSKDTKTGRINSKSTFYHKYFNKRVNDGESRSIIPGMCNSVIEVYIGDVHYMFSDSFSGITNCDILYKSPAGTTLDAFCPVVDLDKEGCSQESLLLKSYDGNSMKGCKDHGELNFIGTSNDLKLKHKRKDSSSSSDVRGYFCIISIQSEIKSGKENTIVSIGKYEVGYIVRDGTVDFTESSFYFQGRSLSTLQIVCPMVELNEDGCNEESLMFVDTGYESNSITSCQVSCKTSLSTTSNDLEVIYRGMKGSGNAKGYFCIVVVNEAPTTTTSTTTTSTTTTSTTTTSTTTTSTTTTSTTTMSTTTSTTTTTTTTAGTTTTTTTACPSKCDLYYDYTYDTVGVRLCLETATYEQAKCTCDTIGQGMVILTDSAVFSEYVLTLGDYSLECNGLHAWAPFTDVVGIIFWDADGSVVDTTGHIEFEAEPDPELKCAYYDCGVFIVTACDVEQAAFMCSM